MKSEEEADEMRMLSDVEMATISGGTGLTKVIIIIDGVPTVFWV